MSYLIRSFTHNVTKLTYGSFRSKTDLVQRSNLRFAYLASSSVQTRVRRREETAIDEYFRKLDSDARRLGRISYNDVRGAFEVIKAKRSASVTNSLMLIRCCGSLLIEELPETRIKLVQEMWRTLESLGASLDISHYNALLSVYLENEYDFKPSDILADLEKRGLEPNRVTYQRLITRYCQIGDISGATSILEFMREKEMPVNVTVFNALIMGHSQSNDMASAEGILNVMKQANIETNGETYSQLICGYIKHGDLQKAKEHLRAYEARDNFFGDKEYFDVISSFSKYGYEDEIDQILSKLRRIPGYNQEAMNSIYRLLDLGKTETCFKILKTMVRGTKADGSVLPVGGFFIAHLVRLNHPPETVAKYCQELMKENLNPLALQVAMECSLRFQKEKTALYLFNVAKENGITIRQHFFWPLLILHGKNKDKSGIFNILGIMHRDFDLSANTETIREYVIPYVLSQPSNVEPVLMDLKACGCTVASGVSSIVHHYLIRNEIEKAASVAQNFRAHYSPYIFRHPLVNAFLYSKDVKSFVLLLREVIIGLQNRAVMGVEKADEDEVHNVPDYRETVGQFVKDAIKGSQRDPLSSPQTQRLLEEMKNQALGLSPAAAQEVQQILQNLLTPQISELLETLTSESFTTPPSSSKGSRISMGSLDENSLERLRDTMKANNESLYAVQKQLFITYARNKNLEKLLKLKEEMDAENFIYPAGMKAFLIDTFLYHDKLDEALQIYDSMVEEHPEFSLDAPKLLRFALKLVENDKIEKALEILNKRGVIDKETSEDGSFLTSSLCWRILNVFAEKGDVDRVNEFFNLFMKHELTEVNNILLGPLIKVHIRRDDVDEAMKVFERCCEKYRCTPWKNELARVFIEKEDATNLQKLTDLSTSIHGEVNSLYDLMLSFLECGRVRQAKKILETPGLRVRHDRIRNACDKYTNEGSVDNLENLLELTKNIGSVNRSELYYSMLKAHDRSDDPQKALGLWMQMQEEDVQPTAQFLYLLASILERHRIAVPFAVPSKEEIEHATDSKTGDTRDKIRVSRTSQSLRRFLNMDDVDQALELKQKIGAEKLNKIDWSLLISTCAKQNRFKEAHQLLEEYYSRSNDFPFSNHLRTLLTKSANNGDVVFFNSWKDRISENLRRAVSFETQRLRAYTTADRIDEYLNLLEEKIDRVNNEDDFRAFESGFPKGALVAVLCQRPELVPKVQAIIKKCEEKGSDMTTFDNFWWIYLMSTNQLDAAQKLWDEKIKLSPRNISFGRMSQEIQRTGSVELAKVFLNMLLSKTNVTPPMLGIAYGSLITVLTQRNEINQALSCLAEAVEKIPMSLIMRSSLILLKSACDVQNIPFPYTVPKFYANRKPRRDDISDSDND